MKFFVGNAATQVSKYADDQNKCKIKSLTWNCPRSFDIFLDFSGEGDKQSCVSGSALPFLVQAAVQVIVDPFAGRSLDFPEKKIKN